MTTLSLERGEKAREKQCSKCRALKSVEGFYRSKASKDGRQNQCKTCTSERHALKVDERRQYAWEWTLRNKFGITPDDYQRMLEDQGGVCAVCGGLDYGNKKLAVDHDHATGKVRGLLCRRCNMGIGLLQDDQRVLRRALAYLEG
jgi:hypothetical protein